MFLFAEFVDVSSFDQFVLQDVKQESAEIETETTSANPGQIFQPSDDHQTSSVLSNKDKLQV